MTDEEPSKADQVTVLHSLTDQRVNLTGEEVLEVAGMTYEQRQRLLTKVVERAQEAAMKEWLTRELAKRFGDR